MSGKAQPNSTRSERLIDAERRRLRRDMREALAPRPLDTSKESIRQRHSLRRDERLLANRTLLAQKSGEFVSILADGGDIDPQTIRPEVRLVQTEDEAALYRIATLNWSVPVTSGFGRRTRFLVFDKSNEKLIGIFCLSDPVFNLAVRDSYIGWSIDARRARLGRVLEASVLGALPPYNMLLGGKLVALCAISSETLALLARKYRGRRTVILNRRVDGRPVLVTTSSALGRSSLYNRLQAHGRLYYDHIGWTRGFGTFHVPKPLFERVGRFLNHLEIPEIRRNRFGQGPNWKVRVLRVALEELGLDAGLQRHGIQREVFAAPTARNWREVLTRGARPEWYGDRLEDLGALYRERWAIPRAARIDYRTWSRTELKWLFPD
jgi:hypothetical protein